MADIPPATTDASATGDKKLSDAAFKKEAAEREEQRFEAAKKALRRRGQRLARDASSRQKPRSIDDTPEGLRIQLVDQDKTPMFPTRLGRDERSGQEADGSGGDRRSQQLPNKISISGHTDSTQYALGAKYTNWELSADRANATRREFLNDGVPPDRLSRVIGMADQDPLDKSNAADPQNRRISIVLLRENQDQPAASKQAQADPTPLQPTQSASR